MVNGYEGFNPPDQAVEYFLEIIAKCRELHPSDAEDRFSDLEYLFKSEGFGNGLVTKLNEAKKMLNSLSPYSTRSPEYVKCFNKLKESLAYIQEEFVDKYRKTA